MSDQDGEQGPQTIAALGLTVDLRAEPWRYPGPFLPFSCLQIGERLLPLHAGSGGALEVLTDGRRKDVQTLLREQHGVELSACHFVIAIGSNASPDVLRRKFERRNVSTTVPQIVGRLEGFALGYSAHVSPAGYVPVAAYPHSSASVTVVVSALAEQQLHCIDETEPNYVRTTVPRDRIQLALPVPLPESLYLYESKWGVIVDTGGEPVPFGVQESIFARLARWGILPQSMAMGDGVPSITRALGRDAESRERIRSDLTPHAVGSRSQVPSPGRTPGSYGAS